MNHAKRRIRYWRSYVDTALGNIKVGIAHQIAQGNQR